MKLEESGYDTVKGNAIHGSIKKNHKQQQAENPVCSAKSMENMDVEVIALPLADN